MKINRSSRAPNRGILLLDLAVGLGLLTAAMLPLAFSFAREARVMQAEYAHAVAMEIVDGEAEILAAGAGKDIPEGTEDYTVHLKAATKLPDGKFQLTRTGDH